MQQVARARSSAQPPPRSLLLRRGWWPLLLCLLAGSAGRAAGEVRMGVELDPPSISMGDHAVLSVTVEGAVNLDQTPSVPPIAGLEVRGAGQSTNISIVNGKMSRSITFQFVLYPLKQGEYSIGPIEIREGGKLYRSDAVELTVGSGAATGPAGGRTGGPGQPGAGQPGAGRAGAGGAPAAGAEPEPTESGDIFAQASIDRDHVVVGEQITLRFQFYQRLGYPLLESPQYTPPETEGFWREEIPPQRSSTRTLRGGTYQVTEIVYALFPAQSGRLQIGPGSLDCVIRERTRARDPFSFFGGFGGGRRVQIRSRPIPVRVDPLPEPKPADFTGGVGRYTLDATLTQSEVAQNDPVTLTLTIEGTGNVSTVGEPRLPEMVGLRSYPSGSDVRTEKRADRLAGRKTFSVVLVPESTGRREIPSIHLSVFDPDQRRYVQLASDPVVFQVTPAREGGGASGGEVARVGRDLRTIRTATEFIPVGPAYLWQRPSFWLWQIVPLGLLALAWTWRRRREKREANWGLVLSRGAAGRLRRDLEALRSRNALDPARGFDQLDEVLERYFTDRFRMPVRGRTREELQERLAQEGVGPEGWNEVRALLDRCDFARFAAQARTEEDLREAVEMAVRLPQFVEGKRSQTRAVSPFAPVLVLLGFWSAAAGLAAPATALNREEAGRIYQRANEAYQRGENLTAAREYGRILTAGYQSPDLFLNLGNANYRAGRIGWAVYYFERGRRLAPSDPDLRVNLELALQETKDRVPEVDSSDLLRGLVWLQDRTSANGALHWFSRFWWLFVVWVGLRLAFGGGGHPSSASRRLRGKASWGVGVALAFLLLLSGAWAGMKIVQAGGAPDAVVVRAELPVRSNPDPEATVEFTLHAGTRIRQGRARQEFREVVFSSKLRGWAEAEGLVSLDARGEIAVPEEDRGGTGEGSFSAGPAGTGGTPSF